MSETRTPPAQEPLGVGAIISESFSILFKHIPAVMVMGIAPVLLTRLYAAMFLGWDGALLYAINEDYFDPVMTFALLVSIFVVEIMAYSLNGALVAQLSYDSKLGRPLRLQRYWMAALFTLPVVLVLSLVSVLLTIGGLLLLVVPGLLVMAMFSVLAPAVVIERVGLRGLHRSHALTKGYLWPIVGTLILVGVVVNIVDNAAVFLADMAHDAQGTAAGVLVYCAVSAISYGLGGILAALIYARLREIKEGVSIDEIAAVFD
ncbi:hypothetical protein AIOL_000262 [Candidatus Rhodobacter oscarellae]|uniref:Glycerophosphoryl diester phosphodiesterase membrane domain-containing protein n=1 Tax=Candidatus Rhodobacter oscarellae TaxID=1675527 RepID=A0A0J9EBH3_9RHOB|nr:hypothetical protein [Candidatus Rhodobacter lobularis]KMW60110.1 hypothetical protein AIOL_000262 [Candidatus Rhodobacter lobularis]